MWGRKGPLTHLHKTVLGFFDFSAFRMLTFHFYAYCTNIAAINIKHTNGHKHTEHKLLLEMCLRTFITKTEHRNLTEYDKNTRRT